MLPADFNLQHFFGCLILLCHYHQVRIFHRRVKWITNEASLEIPRGNRWYLSVIHTFQCTFTWTINITMCRTIDTTHIELVVS